MTGKPRLPTSHDEVPQLRAARNPDLRHEDASPADRHVVPYLNQIINHCAIANDRVGTGAAIDRDVRADLDVRADDDPA